MFNVKKKILDDMISHLSTSQGSGLKSLMDESKMPKMPEMGESDNDADDKPKGIKIESVELMGKPENGYDNKVNEAIQTASNSQSSPRIDPKKAAEFEKGFNQSGFQPERWKKNLKEGLGLKASNEDMGDKMGMGEPEMSDDELEELIGKYLA